MSERPSPAPSGPVAVHHRAEGPPQGEVVVLSGSLGSDLRMWEPQVQPLVAAGYRVVRYDHRGHGGSPVPPGPYSIADLGGDLLALLDRIGAERAHLAGISLGGMTGMWLAAHAPARVSSLVLCCTSARLGPPRMWAERAATVRERGTGAVAEAVVARWVTEAHARAHPERMAFLREMVAATPAEGYASCCAAIERMDLLAELPAITAPTLVLAGEQDPATPPEHAELIAREVPGARLALVPGAAHLGTLEQQERFTELIVEHLKGAS
ncbi:3-oxoadipate enol-lactonase [Amycolatopsis aidingensis]|uniref:3-oxoadipate enol-lactonase n=1 Tax=Amycolatopsis aidingensis TaxID=2842453 RepID=UPI001C0C6D52|nr:3-oxoadipate enol-lactonase [Amycolatopsis aidingensis]